MVVIFDDYLNKKCIFLFAVAFYYLLVMFDVPWRQKIWMLLMPIQLSTPTVCGGAVTATASLIYSCIL